MKKDLFYDKNFCAAPWNSILIDFAGNVMPDSQFQPSYGNINNQSFREIWSSNIAQNTKKDFLNNQIPLNCKKCPKKESSVGASRRMFFHDTLHPVLKTNDFNSTNLPDIYFLEINMSNTCNLKCRMCSGKTSTAWIKDEELLKKFDGIYHRNKFSEYTPLNNNIIEKLFEYPEDFRNLCYLSLKGGEPFLEPTNYEILDFMVQENLAKNIVLDLTTNGTIIDDRIFSYAEKFKQIKLHISIEGTGQLYEYIRGGDNFSLLDLERNLLEFDKLKNTRIIFATVLMVYNIFDISNVWKWFLKIKKDNYEIYFKNVVVSPAYLHPCILPLTLRQQAYDLIINENIPEFTNNPIQGNIGVKGLSSGLLNNDYYTKIEQEKYMAQFIDFTRDVDTIRGTDINNIIPELQSLFGR